MAVVKIMTVMRNPDDVFDFFENVKNWESGGALSSITKNDDGWWTVQTAVGMGKVRLGPNRELRTMDHEFVVGGVNWNVYSRIIPNAGGSTMTWTFVCPENMPEEQFTEQLNKGFEMEILNWKKTLENR